MMANSQLFAGSQNASGRIELSSVNAQVDIGHEGAKHQQAVTVLDKSRHALLAHRPLIDADVQGMRFANHALAQQCRGDRYLSGFGESQQLVLQLKTMQFYASQNHGTL